MGRAGVELARVRLVETADIAREFNTCSLHAEADPEIGDLFLARIADRVQHPGDASLAESAWYQDAIIAFQL